MYLQFLSLGITQLRHGGSILVFFLEYPKHNIKQVDVFRAEKLFRLLLVEYTY